MGTNEPTAQLKLKNGATLSSQNYADFAKGRVANERGELRFPSLTTTKLRRIYGNIMNVYTKINVPEDFEKYKSDLQYLKVKMAYESGRDGEVRAFIDGTFLLEMLDGIKSHDQFMLYCRYAESLVAYFKFYGGRD
ncbi:type III-A CRISPR-associated protein Csm2 [uncultured Olsenella sp.]|uniref:type III-A CRISPR-associated protein Csm2 n=1 Tax=uncultured Olsenella sp. TaxID=190764 RepID=UPI0026DB82F5|nr:type III-A CRISPR-associated protein Csm2 [uncultured Olsenella sp.]